MIRSTTTRVGLLILVPVIFIAWYRTQLSTVHKPSPYPLIRNSSIETFQQYLSDGSYTSEDLVRTFLARIAEVNGKLHAVAEINPDALAIARELDKERLVSGKRSELHGIPILIKDTISAHGMNNTAGSYCLVGSKTKNEASLITRLRKAGAIILGKANTSEWGNSRSSGDNASNGWSSWGGQTYGVYYEKQDPCGSSSGSATSMALGLAAVTIGVESVGSITCPAMKSNLVSIKPTSKLVPKDNVIITHLRGGVGPMALRLKDAAIILAQMAGKSDADPFTESIPFDKIPDYVAACKLGALHGSRIGIPRNGLKNPTGDTINMKAIMRTFEQIILLLKQNGATIIDDANYPNWDEVYTASPQGIFGPAEYAYDMAKYFSGLAENPMGVHNISDMIACTKSDPREEYPSRNIAVWEKAVAAPSIDSPEVQAAKEHMLFLGGEGGIDGALNAAKADALILPSVICSDIPGLVGYPTITVPMGYLPDDTPVTRNPRGDLIDEAPNVPFGLCFIGRAFSEEKLIGLAYAFEQLTQVASQRKPILLPKTELSDIVGS